MADDRGYVNSVLHDPVERRSVIAVWVGANRKSQAQLLAQHIEYFDVLLMGLVGMGVMFNSILVLAVTISTYRQQKILRRLLVTRVRQITSTADYVAELLFALAVATGLGAVYDRPDAEIVHRYLRSIVAFSPVTEGMPLGIVIHLLIVQALLVVMPFSHLLHSGGIFIARRFLASPDSFSGDVDQP